MDVHHDQPLALPWWGGSSGPTAMCPALYSAVRKGKVMDVMALLRTQHGVATADNKPTGASQHRRCDVLELSTEGNTAFHVAAEHGHGELIQELYLSFRDEAKGLLAARNSALDTPLHCAARAGSAKAVAVLIVLARDCREESSILGCKNEAGDTALHLAARYGHAAVVGALVSATETAAELNNALVSPLYLAVMSGSEKAVREVITKCNDVSAAGPDSQNALHAAIFQSKGMVDMLLDWRPALAEEGDSSGCTPLHYASSDGNVSLVRAILDAFPGAVYRKDNKGGCSALHVAARMGHDKVVRELLSRCPDAAELRDDDGRTFIHAAAKKKRSKVVSLAIKDFKDPTLRGLLDAQDRNGDTPLHLAVAVGANDVVEALLRKGKVRADVLNNAGHTPFDRVAEATSYFTMVSMVVTLAAFGAQPRPQRKDTVKPWKGRDMVQGIEKTSDSLMVVAVLIATTAFAAGFNLPGGYNDNGMANLEPKYLLNIFLFLDPLAAASSLVAAILLIYGKASCSTGSWRSFVAALHCLWLSVLSLMLALSAALHIVTTKDHRWLLIIHVSIEALILRMTTCGIVPSARCPLKNLKFLWRSIRSKGRHVINRQYPLAGAFIPNLILFTLTNCMASIGFIIISVTHQVDKFYSASLAPPPTPL